MNANPFAQSFPGAPQATPTGFGAPPQASPQGPTPAQAFGSAGAPVAQAPAGGFGLGLPSINDVTEAGGRSPTIPTGTHLLEFSSNTVKTRQGHTVAFSVKVVQTDNTGFPPGSELSFIKKIPPNVDKRGSALGEILAAVRAFAGFKTEDEFKTGCPQANQLFQGALAGQPLPFTGRKSWCRATQGDQVIDSRTGQPAPGKYWMKLDWQPA